jgi:acyl carrier protein
MASMLLADEDSRSALGSLRTLLLGGEALPAALARKIRESTQAELFNMYGPTETTVWSSVHRVEEVGDSIPIGHPIANTELYVLDARRALVPIGGIGELYIGGRGVVRGYLGRPDLTAERFVPHPWRAGERLYRTGDLARHREDGCVEFLGRADQQVKLRGHRIELGEIESLLCEHPAIHEAAVVMRELSPDDQRIVAYVVPQPGLSVDRGDVLSYLRRQLPDFMIPAQVTELAQLPRTPNSKLDRAALPVDAPALPIAAAAPVAASDVEKRIAEIWGEVLGVAQVGFDANFFDLGGHSLLAVRVQGRLEASFGRRVPIVDLFRFPTVRSFAAHLSGAADTGASGGSERADARKRALAARRQRVGSQARS